MLLKLMFVALKKVAQIVQKGELEGGGVEVIWTISKKISTFVRETFPKIKKYKLTYLQK